MGQFARLRPLESLSFVLMAGFLVLGELRVCLFEQEAYKGRKNRTFLDVGFLGVKRRQSCGGFTAGCPRVDDCRQLQMKVQKKAVIACVFFQSRVYSPATHEFGTS
jgi:hypothetical protein